MSKSFVNKINNVRLEALTYIREVVSKRGENPYQLIDPETYDVGYDEEFDDEIYKLPRGVHVGKYGYHDEYPLVTVSIVNDTITFEGISCIGETDEDKMFNDDELDTDVICVIADMIYNLEK